MDIQKNYRIWIRCKKINIRSPLMYITRGSKFVTYNLVQVQQKKNKYNKGVTRTDNCLVTSHSNIWTATLNMIRFPDRDPTGFWNTEPDPDWTGFRKAQPDQTWISKLR